jgi:hypothetical protein
MGCRACPSHGRWYCDECAAIAARQGILVPTAGAVPRRVPLTLDAEAPEGVLEDRLRVAAHDLGYLYYHTYNSKRSDPGWLDCALVHPEGSPLYLWELKSADGRVSPAQQRWLDALAQASAIHTGVYVPDNLPQMIDLLARRATS